jgi:hypothetical protein
MSNCFLNRLQLLGNKSKNWQIKLKIFCISKELPEWRDNPQNWKKTSPVIQWIKNIHIVKMHIYTSRICKEIKKVNMKRIIQVNKWQIGQLPEEVIQITNKYMKKCSISLDIEEMQIKTTLRFHLTQSERQSSNEQQIQLRMWEKGTLILCW